MTEEYMKRKYEELESMREEQSTDCAVILTLCVLLYCKCFFYCYSSLLEYEKV